MRDKLFDDGDNDENLNLSEIKINPEYARKYEHNKKREDLQRYEDLKKKGQISDSASQEESSDSSDEEDDPYLTNPNKMEDVKFIQNLIKVRNQDPSIFQKDVTLFVSDDEENEESNVVKKEKKKEARPKYLKDVQAQHLIEGGPEFSDEDEVPSKKKKKRKTYHEEQQEFKDAFFEAVKDVGEDGGDDLLKVKESGIASEEMEEEDEEFKKNLDEYFGHQGKSDEDQMFLKEYFEKKMWVDKDPKNKNIMDDDEFDELMRDEEEVEKQEEYEFYNNFRHEEDVGDQVIGHPRKIEGSVRKKENARKEQRKSKDERMKIAEMERREELKHLKNLKKEEMKERMKKFMEAAGIKDGDDCPMELDDLEEDFDPEEYDKMMKKAFDEKYYEQEDVDPSFGDENESDIEKPDFDKEDELFGLFKGWDAPEKDDGFLALRDRVLKQKADDLAELHAANTEEDEEKEEEEEEEGGGGDREEKSEESKRGRKRKLSLLKKVKEEMMEEYYKLDYEDTVGDLKTRFKYTKVKPKTYGLKTEAILMLDDKELNQHVSIKKIAPYREKEWIVPKNKIDDMKKKTKDLTRNVNVDSKKSDKKVRMDGKKVSSVILSEEDGKAEMEESNIKVDSQSRKAKRKKRQKELKLLEPRRQAYGIRG